MQRGSDQGPHATRLEVAPTGGGTRKLCSGSLRLTGGRAAAGVSRCRAVGLPCAILRSGWPPTAACIAAGKDGNKHLGLNIERIK